MADISKLSRLLNGLQRQVDLSTNTLVVDNMKIKAGSGNDANHATFAGTLTAARTITIPDSDVDLSNISTNTAHLDGTASKHDASEIDVEAADGKNHSQSDLETIIGELDDAIGDFATATYNNYADPTSHDVVAHLNAIDTALAAAGGVEFSDATFRINDDVTPSKQIAFEASAITASNVRTIAMADEDIDLGLYFPKDGSKVMTGNLQLGGNNITSSGAMTISNTTGTITLGSVSGNGILNLRAATTINQYLGADNICTWSTGETRIGLNTSTLVIDATNFRINQGANTIGQVWTATNTSGTGAWQDAPMTAVDKTNHNALITLSGVAAGSENLGAFTGSVITDNTTIKNALQELETYAENISSIANNFEWANSAADYIVDNTAVPPTENPGDRYVLSDDGGAPNAAWDGASAGDIVEFNSTSGLWEATTPTTGTFISVDDDQSGLYQWGGSSWAFKAFEATTASGLLTKDGFDIKIADSTAANIIVYNSSGIASSVAMSGEATISNTGVITLSDGDVVESILGVALDTATNGTPDQFSSIVGAIGYLTANQTDLHALTGVPAFDQDLGTFTGSTILDNRTIKAALQDLETAHEEVDANANDLITLSGVAENTTDLGTFTGTTIADNQTIKGALQDLETQVDANEADIGTLNSAVSDNTDAIAALQTGSDAVIKSFTAGEAMAAETTFLVRMALNGETAGRVYKADEDAASTDSFYVIGVVMSDVAVSAGDTVSVTMMGESSLGTSDTAFAAGDVGKPVYLGASGAFSTTAPTLTDKAVVRVGIVQETTKILVQAIQLNGIN
jgi:hypothetical protein